jgi:hypothetical protein
LPGVTLTERCSDDQQVIPRHTVAEPSNRFERGRSVVDPLEPSWAASHDVGAV